MNVSPEDKEIILEFVNESSEGLEQAESNLLKLEESLSAGGEIASKTIDDIFRTFHSIKGSAGFLGFNLINKITHNAESLLDKIRKGRLTIAKSHIDIFLEVCDALQVILDHINQEFSEENFDESYEDLIKRLDTYGSQEAPAEESTETEKAAAEEEANPETETTLPENADLITDELREQFVTESRELLDQMEQDLIQLEKDPQNEETLKSVFRALHSLKGNAGFLNLKDINEVAHQAETIFDLARNREIVLNSKQISLILKIIDFLRLAVDGMAEGRPVVIPGKLGLIDLLREMTKTKEDSTPEPKEEAEETRAGEEQATAKEKKEEENPEKNVKVPKVKKVGEVIRVDVEKLNRLMDLVGEIVIAESMVSHHPELADLNLESFEKAIAYLQKNIRELQDLATSMRMIPLSGLFSKMRRLVRDISVKKQKQVELVISGGETEVDRSVIEHISDPLVHILRNSIDHGIEDKEERLKKGKPEQGVITLDARRVGGEIWIVIADDGRGLDKEKILKRAIERKLINEKTDKLTDDQIYNLIFTPGFSTAEKVTNISGRGVGMDVVKKNVEKIRGRIDVSTIPGQGTTIHLKIPLTTAIIDGMLMRVDQSLYAIPTLDIRESLQVQSQEVIDLVDGQEVIKVRDQIIPVIRLQELHNKTGAWRPLQEGIVVITQSTGHPVGFLVDEIVGQQQLVIKPLPHYIGKLPGVSGCAVLGDGNICLILDLASMVKIAESVKI